MTEHAQTPGTVPAAVPGAPVPPALAAELEKLYPWLERLFWAVLAARGPVIVQHGRRNGLGIVRRLVQEWRERLVNLSFEEIDRLMGEDPDDRAIREAHGFTCEDDWQDESLLCRNGCGLSYPHISSGKIRVCRAGRDCQAAHCPPSMHTDCEWPRCAEPVQQP